MNGYLEPIDTRRETLRQKTTRQKTTRQKNKEQRLKIRIILSDSDYEIKFAPYF